jgi:hypothetical protein
VKAGPELLTGCLGNGWGRESNAWGLLILGIHEFVIRMASDWPLQAPHLHSEDLKRPFLREGQ